MLLRGERTRRPRMFLSLGARGNVPNDAYASASNDAQAVGLSNHDIVFPSSRMSLIQSISDSDTHDSDDSLESSDPFRTSRRTTIPSAPIPPKYPAIPSYTDSRPTIKTYFKIFSPSKAGRLLSVYESAPDKFDFSQSWGWRSSTLMLDEGFEDDALEDATERLLDKKNRSSVLKFSVVIGNL